MTVEDYIRDEIATAINNIVNNIDWDGLTHRIIHKIPNEFGPNDIFSNGDLKKWALENGFREDFSTNDKHGVDVNVEKWMR